MIIMATLLVSSLALVCAANMNGRPGQYTIANSNNLSGRSFSTDYDGEFFDVLSPTIRTRYSEVYWKMQDAVPLPDSIRDRFKGKTIAITGYEVDQVDKNGDSVPITYAYNHHYGAWLLNGDKVELVEGGSSEEAVNMGLNHGSEHSWVSQPLQADTNLESELPLMQFFSEANGGEMRLSYHGYPKGYAQILDSPTTFKVIPMQIDTWNREKMTTTKFWPGPLPDSSRIPTSAGYSGLIECPCSDRLEKKWAMTYALQSSGSCTGDIRNASECFEGAEKLVQSEQFSNHVIDDPTKDRGCNIEQHSDGSTGVWWNSAIENVGSAPIISPASSTSAFSRSQVNMTVNLQDTESDNAVTITIVGPADRWFGVGFGASSMCVHMKADQCLDGGPYTIVVSGNGQVGVTERRLDFHGPGTVVAKSVTVQSNTVAKGNRTVVLTRPLKGASDLHFSFDPSVTTVPIVTAIGCSLEFAQHCGHGPSSLNFLATDTPSPICQAGIEGSIGGNEFNNNRCAPFPKSDLEVQHNPTCSVETYQGGLTCCRHGQSLLDKDQDIPWPDKYLEYRLKFRFYFEEYTPAEVGGSSLPSHSNLVRLYWQTEAHAGEYDIVPCSEGIPPDQCVQIITSRWEVRDMMSDCFMRNDASWCTGKGSADDKITEGIKIIYAGPHCHAPHCLSMDLYNADTGQLLCHVEPIQGVSDELYDEHGFLAIPPCLWGDTSEGLIEPELLSLGTTLLSVKRNNNTIGHTGEMASWQMRGVVVARDQKHEPPLLPTSDDTAAGIERIAETSKHRSQLRNAAD